MMFWFVLLLFFASPVAADSLRIGWVEEAPYLVSHGGEPVGALREIAEEIVYPTGITLQFVQLPSVSAGVRALEAGHIHAQIGLSGDSGGAIESPPLWSVPYREYRPKGATASQRRVALVPPVPRRILPLLAQGASIDYVSTGAEAFGQILAGYSDMAILRSDHAEQDMLSLGLEDSFEAEPEPYFVLSYRFLLHRSKSHLWPDIRRQISWLRASGRLQTILSKHGLRDMSARESAPPVFRVAIVAGEPLVTQMTPTAKGLGPDLVRALSKAAGWRLSLSNATAAEAAQLLQTGQVDAVLRYGRTDLRLGGEPLGAYTMRDATPDASDYGILPQWPVSDELLAAGNQMQLGSLTKALSAAARGEIDGVVLPIFAVSWLGPNWETRFRSPLPIGEEDFGLDLAPWALKPAQAAWAGALESGEVSALTAIWRPPRMFWTRTRLAFALRLSVFGLIILTGGLLFYLGTRRERQRLRHLALLAEGSRDAVITWTEATGIVAWNEAARALYGYDPPSVVGKLPDKLLRSRAAQPSEARSATGTELVWQTTCDQREIAVERRRQHVERSGQVVILDVCQDVTGQRQVSVLRNMVRNLRRREEELATVNRDLEAFAYATSHDLKAPANTVAMLSEALRDVATGDQAAELLDDLDHTARDMQGLIDDVLVYAQQASSGLDRSPVALSGIAREVCLALKPQILHAGAKIIVDALPVVSATPQQMRHLLQNLIENALKFREPGQELSVAIRSLDRRHGRVGFAVSDTGIGVAPEHRMRVMDPFVRLSTGQSGHGLGLSLCRRIALQYGGWIEICAAPEGGTEVRIYLEEGADDQHAVAG